MPPLPAHARQVWAIFLELHSDRTSGFNAPNGITAADMLAWEQLNRTHLTPWEQTVIRQLDRVFFDHLAKHQPGNKTPPPPHAD